MKHDLGPPAPIWVLGLGVLLCSSPVWAGIDTTPAFPVEGEPATITVTTDRGSPVAEVAVQAVYRPGSAVEKLEDIGFTGVDGAVTWSPTGAGVVILQTVAVGDNPSYTSNLSVRYNGLPISGLVILLLAGVFLYGGVIKGFRSLRSLPPQLPPDT